MCITFQIYDHLFLFLFLFLFSLIVFPLEPACKKSGQPIADELTDIQITKSTAEKPHNSTVPNLRSYPPSLYFDEGKEELFFAFSILKKK